MKTEELKPCPFCGGKAGVMQMSGKIYAFVSAYKKSDVGYIQCTNCQARTKIYSNTGYAIKKWNHRVNAERKGKKNERIG